VTNDNKEGAQLNQTKCILDNTLRH
jgi:hypothetical protein